MSSTTSEGDMAAENDPQVHSDSPPRYIANSLAPLSPTATAGAHLLQLASGKDSVAPPLDDKYLDNSLFHYTSSFQARPQAEYFDFDERYMYHSDEENTQENEENIESNQLNLDDQVEFEPELSHEEENLESIMEKVNICKVELREMIEKIDRSVSCTIPYKSTGDETPAIAKELASMLSLVNYKDILLPLVMEKQRIVHKVDVNSVTGPYVSAQPSNKVGSLLGDDPCANLPNFGVVLVKSPSSIAQLWDEYTKIPSEWPVADILAFTQQQGVADNNSNVDLIAKRKTSIRRLEQLLGSSWRNDDKNLSRQINRRKKIWKAIEEGVQDGLSLQDCFLILENYAQERGKGLSWYYNGVPFRLIDMSSKINRVLS